LSSGRRAVQSDVREARISVFEKEITPVLKKIPAPALEVPRNCTRDVAGPVPAVRVKVAFAAVEES
jgi:hypothetical protein